MSEILIGFKLYMNMGFGKYKEHCDDIWVYPRFYR